MHFIQLILRRSGYGEIVKITTSDEAVRELCKSDILLCKLINVIGDHSMVLQSNYFESLVKNNRTTIIYTSR